MRTVNKTARAEADIAQEIAYLEERSPPAAVRFVAEIDARTAMIASQPMMGRARDDLATGLRSTVIGKFLLFYTFTETELIVARVLHGSRDIDRIFRDDGV